MDELDKLIEYLKSSHRFFNVHRGFKQAVPTTEKQGFSPQEEERVEAVWDNLLKTGKVKFSKPLIGVKVEGMSRRQDSLLFPVYETDFKHYRATLDDESTRVWALGVSGLTRITHRGNSWFIFGERNGKNMSTGGVIENVPGGFVEPAHLNEENPFNETYFQELAEEVGIKDRMRINITPFYSAQLRVDARPNGRKYQDVCLELLADIDGLSPADVLQRFGEKGEREHSRLHIVPSDELPKFTFLNRDRFNLRAMHTLQLYLQDNYRK